MKNDEDIRFFLNLGYFPGYKQKIRLNTDSIEWGRHDNESFEALIARGTQALRDSVALHFDPNARHVVPLSGGLDSRAILAALMELTSPENIETYTFGTPGTFDYDLGCAVAKAAGTKHTAIALDKVEWTENDFIEAAGCFDYQTFLFHHVPLRMLERFKGATIWSGYIGDVVTGAQMLREPSEDLQAAKTRYIQRKQIVKSMKMAERAGLEKFIGSMDLKLTPDECVYFGESGSVTAPHVLMSGFDYKTPFINSPFWDFFMAVPSDYRRDQKLFTAMLRKIWPDLFLIPTKSYYGLKLSASFPEVVLRRARNKIWNLGRCNFRQFDWPALPMTNYMDLDLLLRKDESLQEIVCSRLRNLKHRGAVPFVDIDTIWQRHMTRKALHGDAIKILFSLEMNLSGLESQKAAA